MVSSVLKYFFEEDGKLIHDDVAMDNSQASHVLKLADLRDKGVLPLDEENSAFKYTNLIQICYQALVNAADTRFIFCIILLAINLISRSEQLSNLRYSFIIGCFSF